MIKIDHFKKFWFVSAVTVCTLACSPATTVSGPSTYHSTDNHDSKKKTSPTKGSKNVESNQDQTQQPVTNSDAEGLLPPLNQIFESMKENPKQIQVSSSFEKRSVKTVMKKDETVNKNEVATQINIEPRPIRASGNLTENAPLGTKYSLGDFHPPIGVPHSVAYSTEIEEYYSENPRLEGECSLEIHAKYWVLGDDGKVYPTWHPPIDQRTNCKFGHEHGADPRIAFELFKKVGPPPFGYAAERVNSNPEIQNRKQFHFGYKLGVENEFGDGDLKCSTIILYHHEVTTADPITNNLHEYQYYMNCNNSTLIKFRALLPLGVPGEVENRCQGASGPVYETGLYSPLYSPSASDSLGPRSISSWQGCVAEKVNDGKVPEGWQIGERWLFMPSGEKEGLEYSFAITTVPGSSGRIVKLDEPGKMIRTIDLCRDNRVTSTEECKFINSNNIKWNDPRSPWNGDGKWIRPVWIFRYVNNSSSERWYTDAFGDNLSKTPIANGLEQYFSFLSEKFDDSDLGDINSRVKPVENSGVRLPN